MKTKVNRHQNKFGNQPFITGNPIKNTVKKSEVRSWKKLRAQGQGLAPNNLI